MIAYLNGGPAELNGRQIYIPDEFHIYRVPVPKRHSTRAIVHENMPTFNQLDIAIYERDVIATAHGVWWNFRGME